jgi:hypothetical protein
MARLLLQPLLLPATATRLRHTCVSTVLPPYQMVQHTHKLLQEALQQGQE